MDNTDLLPRRLSAAGCVIAGNQLTAHRAALVEKKIKLPKELAANADRVVVATDIIVALGASDASMTDIDRGADRFISAFDGCFAEMERSLDSADLLPLTAEEQENLELVRSTRAKLFPLGTDFIRAPYRKQWERMNAIRLEIEKPETAAAIEELSLSIRAERFIKWVELYGAKLGVTKAQDANDPAAVAVDAWHLAWADFLVEVRAVYRDPTNPDHVVARQMLLAPYEDQARAERAEEVKAIERAKRRENKPAKDDKAAGEGKPQ